MAADLQVNVLAVLFRRAGRAGRVVLDVLLPPQCLTCDAAVDAPGQFCPPCFAETSFITEPCCQSCSLPFAQAGHDAAIGQGRAGRHCAVCIADPPPWQRARAALLYDAQSRRVVLPFKHADRPELADALARLMAGAGATLLQQADILVPVPLHRRRLLARRYNQSALLAQRLARRSGVPSLPDALCRIRATSPLGELSAQARARMMQDAIVVRPARAPAIAGRRVLLIDDVLTTGATAAACTVALLDGGAATVDILVAARVPPPRRAAENEC